VARRRHLWGSNDLALPRGDSRARWQRKMLRRERQSWTAQQVCLVSVLRPWRGRKVVLLGLAASARGLVVASSSVRGIGASVGVMKCRRSDDMVWRAGGLR
jgi:hypothetical protein